MEKITRRQFIGKTLKYGAGVTLLTMGGLSLAGCGTDTNTNTNNGGNAKGKSPKYVVKLALIDPEGHPHVTTSQEYAKLVSEKTNGAVEVQVYSSAQLGQAGDLLKGMQQGTIEAFFGAVTWLGSYMPDFYLPGTLYLFKDQKHCREVHLSDAYNKLSEEVASKHGIRVASMAYDRGPRHLMCTKPVKSLEDFQGLKVRVPPQNSWVMNFELAGAAPHPMPLSETFTGLQQGMIDATEQASNWLYFNKYYTIANNLTLSYHNYEQGGLFFSERIFSAYPQDIQKILLETAEEVAQGHNDAMEKDIVDSEAKMKEENVVFHQVNVKEWDAHFKELIPQLSKELGYSESLVNSILKS